MLYTLYYIFINMEIKILPPKKKKKKKNRTCRGHLRLETTNQRRQKNMITAAWPKIRDLDEYDWFFDVFCAGFADQDKRAGKEENRGFKLRIPITSQCWLNKKWKGFLLVFNNRWQFIVCNLCIHWRRNIWLTHIFKS